RRCRKRGEPSFFYAVGADNGDSKPNPEQALNHLNKSIARLTRNGHPQAMTYPWGLFLVAIQEANTAHE
ncbi:MAG: hypothetical protein WCS28_12305, partial [Thiomicrospira sp.]